MAADPTQLQRLALLLGPDPFHFENLVNHLMSSSNDQRSAAESLFNICKQAHPESLLLRLAQLVSSSAHTEVRAMSAILLRKHLTRLASNDDSFLYPKLSESTRSAIKNILLSSLQRETTKSIIKKINDTVSELAASILPDGGWPELLPFMFQCVTAQNHNLQESALLIFARLAQFIGETLIPHLSTLHELFLNCLSNSTSAEVRIAALNAAISFIICLSNNNDREKFQDLLPLMVRTLTEALNSKQEATAQEALELLIELAGSEPRFLRKQIVEVVGSMLQIAEAESLEEGTRHLAVEFVITLAEARERAPGMMRKFPQFVHSLFMVLMKMLLDIEDDPVWHSAESEDEDAGETSNYGFGQECLDRLSISLGGNTMVPVASEIFQGFLAAPEWEKHHAALIALAQIAEGSSKVMLKNLEQYNQRVLPALAGAMDDFQNPRVQTGKRMVQEGALTALASVADSSQDQFQKYYDAVMPYLKAILVNANDKSNRMLRAKAMECISLVGMAVGRDKFRDDARQSKQSCQSSPMLNLCPDLLIRAVLLLIRSIGMGQALQMPWAGFSSIYECCHAPLLQSAQLKPDVTITSADSDVDIDDDDSIETITLGDKRIGIKTSVLEEKATACNMLCCYADELKEGFFPWIDQVATTLVPLLKFYFHEEVRKAAVSAMPELLRSAKLAIEKGQSHGRNESYLKQLSDYIIPALMEALHKELEVEICASMLDSLTECVQVSGPILDENQVRSIVDEVKQVITASTARKQERAERAKAEDFDAEEGELLKEENEQEEEIFDQVGELLGMLIKTFGASFLPFFDELSSYITPMWGKDKTAEERRIAICIFDDVVEQCQEAALKYYDTYVPFLLEACNDENPDVRQAAVYGVGVCAEFGGSVFKPLVREALSKLNVIISDPSAHLSDNAMAYDNAVSALGKICQFHRDRIDSAQVVPAWLSCLPIKSDLIEAKLVHDQLCSMVERSDRELLGLNNQYLPKVVHVFSEVICAGKDLATEQTTSRMINLLRQLQQKLPPAALASTWSSLEPQKQLALQSILSS
ncbi:hypothetical protein GH714_004942 [Hevea brasiliensis]|uniref:Importin N-terminal domain-containing protein n=1 Tax=Hevea brasiliensis TaxID=3981 RepID=A0A6A6KL86_HEVBR|nr:hypothetical protein GH714_004942 [Hevea brasiliensis]